MGNWTPGGDNNRRGHDGQGLTGWVFALLIPQHGVNVIAEMRLEIGCNRQMKIGNGCHRLALSSSKLTNRFIFCISANSAGGIKRLATSLAALSIFTF